MGRKARIGLTRDFFDESGKFVMPGPGLKLLDEMPNVEYQMFPEFLREVNPEQIKGFDMVVTFRPLWTKQNTAGNNQLLSIHHGGVGYERLDVPRPYQRRNNAVYHSGSSSSPDGSSLSDFYSCLKYATLNQG